MSAITLSDRDTRIVEDIAARGAVVSTVLAVYDGQLHAITYDAAGSVTNISSGDTAITMYGKASASEHAMRELFTINCIDREIS